MTALDLPHMSAESAMVSVDRARTHLEAAAEEVVRQINGRAWIALGYESWDDMREAEYRGAAVIVPRADRPELVAKLRAEGLSQREIGDTLGVTDVQVGRDLRNQQMSDTEPATRTDSLGRERPTTYAPRAQGKGLPDDACRPSPVEGLSDPAPLVPSEAVTEFLDSDEELKRARYLHAFTKALVRAHDIKSFDAEKLGDMADPDLERSLDDYLMDVRSFVERFHRARRGLQVIQGGRQ